MRQLRDSLLAGSNSTSAGPPPLLALNYPSETIPVSPRREVAPQRLDSPNVFARGGGVILNIGMMDGIVVSKSIADGKPFAAASTAGIAAFPRRRSRSASISSQHRRDQMTQAAGKADSREAPLPPGMQVSHIEATGSTLRTGQEPNAPGYLLIPGASGAGKSREPFTVRAAAVAEAAASMASATSPVSPRHQISTQRTQLQLKQRASQSIADGLAASVAGGAMANIPPNFFTNNSSLTAPLMTIVSSKARDATSSVNKMQLQFQEVQDPFPARPHTPFGALTGASIASPRASNAITAQAAAMFISTQQRPAKPPASPRQTLLVPPKPGGMLGSEQHFAASSRRLQQRQQEEGLSLVATGPGSGSMNPKSLAISGRTATHTMSMDTPRAVQRQASKVDAVSKASGVGNITGASFSPPVPFDRPIQQSDDLKALLSPRYIVTNPVAPNHPAQFSSSLKQSSIRPQGSARGFANAKSSPRIRHQPSSLASGPASSHLHQQRQQRQPSDLQGVVIAPGK
jgi:hypothetical protein